MDRRFLLAMLLSTIVVVVFNVWFLPAPRKPVPASGRDTTRSAAATAVETPPSGLPATPDTSAAVFAAPDTTAPPVEFSLSSPRARAVFSSRGGGLTSFQLIQFEGPDEKDPVELVLAGVQPSLTLDLGGRRIDLSQASFEVDRQPGAGGSEDIRFQTALAGGLRVVKHFHWNPDSALLDFEVELVGMPQNVAEPTIEVGWSGLPRAEKLPKPDEMAFGAIVSRGKQIERVPAAKFRKERSRFLEGSVQWVGARNKYFFVGIVPAQGAATAAVVSGEAETHRAGALVRVPVVSGGDSRQIFKVYLGPLDYWKLKDVGYGLENAVDLGWKMILPLSHALLWLLVHGYRIIANYGVVIIVLSAATKILFYPMTRSSMHSMQAMQKLQPEMERLRARHKDDPARLNQEVMGLYKKHKVNPLGGCLPMLLQMPVFIALYTVLANSVELRHANFVGWIHDLSAPDVLFRWNTFEFHVLPILMAGSMFWQQKLTPTDPRQAALTYVMPAMMLFFFYGFPSGLALYWTVTNLLSVAQQYLINRERSQGGSEPQEISGPSGKKKTAAAGAVSR